MNIRNVKVNSRSKSIEIETHKGVFSLPFARLRANPTGRNRIADIYVDPELGRRAITYRLPSGKEDSVHLDAFLDYNRDADFLRRITLHNLTVEAVKAFKASGLTKREIIRRLKTSPAKSIGYWIRLMIASP